jgi:hypothetical protein|tara:strand:+ start:324 stop:803 length:480 start_codon:yes stop_codon:yes gene_type:complete
MIPKELITIFSQLRTPVIFATYGNAPHATPMNWNYDKYFWVSAAGGSKKVQNMRMNKKVCIACLEGMQKKGRGFMLHGTIVNMETGLLCLIKNIFILRKMLSNKSTIGISLKLLKFALIYAKHPSVHYSALPWKRYFIKIQIQRGSYWLKDGKKKEFIA